MVAAEARSPYGGYLKFEIFLRRSFPPAIDSMTGRKCSAKAERAGHYLDLDEEFRWNLELCLKTLGNSPGHTQQQDIAN